MTESFVIEFTSDYGHRIAIEVDEEIAYAYYLTETGITGDVWLFNRVEAPNEPPWKPGVAGPFLNSREFAFSYRDSGSVNADDFRVLFNPEDPGGKVAIYLKNRLLAILWDNARPGKSAFARKTSPVAIAFSDGISQAPPEWIY